LLCFPPLGPRGAAFSSFSLGFGPRRPALGAGLALVTGGVVDSEVGRGLAFWKSNTADQLFAANVSYEATYGSEGQEAGSIGFVASIPPAESASMKAPLSAVAVVVTVAETTY
jgi:hypothetical protein